MLKNCFHFFLVSCVIKNMLVPSSNAPNAYFKQNKLFVFLYRLCDASTAEQDYFSIQNGTTIDEIMLCINERNLLAAALEAATEFDLSPSIGCWPLSLTFMCDEHALSFLDESNLIALMSAEYKQSAANSLSDDSWSFSAPNADVVSTTTVTEHPVKCVITTRASSTYVATPVVGKARITDENTAKTVADENWSFAESNAHLTETVEPPVTYAVTSKAQPSKVSAKMPKGFAESPKDVSSTDAAQVKTMVSTDMVTALGVPFVRDGAKPTAIKEPRTDDGTSSAMVFDSFSDGFWSSFASPSSTDVSEPNSNAAVVAMTQNEYVDTPFVADEASIATDRASPTMVENFPNDIWSLVSPNSDITVTQGERLEKPLGMKNSCTEGATSTTAKAAITTLSMPTLVIASNTGLSMASLPLETDEYLAAKLSNIDGTGSTVNKTLPDEDSSFVKPILNVNVGLTELDEGVIKPIMTKTPSTGDETPLMVKIPSENGGTLTNTRSFDEVTAIAMKPSNTNRVTPTATKMPNTNGAITRVIKANRVTSIVVKMPITNKGTPSVVKALNANRMTSTIMRIPSTNGAISTTVKALGNNQVKAVAQIIDVSVRTPTRVPDENKMILPALKGPGAYIMSSPIELKGSGADVMSSTIVKIPSMKETTKAVVESSPNVVEVVTPTVMPISGPSSVLKSMDVNDGVMAIPEHRSRQHDNGWQWRRRDDESRTCSVCSKKFTREYDKRRHERKVHGQARAGVTDDVSPCDLCGRAFSGAYEKRRHKKNVHGLQPPMAENESVLKCLCHRCGDEFGSKTALVRHLRAADGDCRLRPWLDLNRYRVPVGDGETYLKCDQCAYHARDTYRTRFREHMAIHEAVASGAPRLPCEHCDKTFRLDRNRRRHVARVHGDSTKKHECRHCGRLFGDKDALGRHEAVHTDIRQFVCDVCGKAFRQRTSLNLHVRSTHNRERSHACPHCAAAYFKRAKLLAHIKTHTGVRDVPCTGCPKMFSCRENMVKHAKTVHAQTRDFKCTACDRDFKSRKHLVQHGLLHKREAAVAAVTVN